MKRGKDDEKIAGPMFPRLHVNDTEKGGPRAPPRNKMALYEQLSVPSQRFNPGFLPLKSSKTANSVPPSSSSPGSGCERGKLFPLHQHPSTRPAEKTQASYSDLNTPMVRHEPEKKLDEEDFTVPIFLQSVMARDPSINNNVDRERISRSNSTRPDRLMKFQSAGDKEPKGASMTGFKLRQQGRNQSEDNSMDIAAARDSNFSKLRKTDACLQREYGAGSQPGSILHGDVEEQRSPDDIINDGENLEEKTCGSLQTENVDRSDDASETSIVDSISAFDISPDDVVGIIGRKHFWKARKAIVNQQRVFAVQVFELHRLIKVQKLIAESPHILHEADAFFTEPLKGSPAKKLALNYIVKPPLNTVKHKDEVEKPNYKMECSAESVVGKTSLSNVPANNRPVSGNPPPTPLTTENKTSLWSFPQPSGHQWLIPIMSPSEGLIYKPYPGPAFMGPGCGGFGPDGSSPMTGNNLNQSCSAQASYHQFQGFGFPSAGQNYFPSYGMPVMNPTISDSAVEQINHFAGSHGHSGQLLGGEANFNMQYQTSSNVPGQKNVVTSDVRKSNAFDDELQGSTASSPNKRRGIRTTHIVEERNMLQFLRSTPAIQPPEEASLPCETHQPTRVIKVVPHNARSATESAARIFQSIQEERKQHD